MTTHSETKKVFVVTHGDKENGSDAGMTEKGVKQIANIGIWGIPHIPQPSLVLIGNGKRFMETYQVLEPVLNEAPTDISGSCDINAPGPGFDPWAFLEGLPKNALLCAGERLLSALGLKDLYEEGALFEISVMIRKARAVLVQGGVK